MCFYLKIKFWEYNRATVVTLDKNLSNKSFLIP